VELAGKIIEHEWGYRAERARIVEFIPLAGTERSVMILAARLGVPIAEPVDMLSVQDRFGALARHPQGTPPRFRDYVKEHRWLAATFLVGLVVVAIQPAMITTVTLFALLFADRLDRSVAPGQTPKPPPNRPSGAPPLGCHEVRRHRRRDPAVTTICVSTRHCRTNEGDQARQSPNAETAAETSGRTSVPSRMKSPRSGSAGSGP